MAQQNQQQLGSTLWKIAAQLRGAMNTCGFCKFDALLKYLRSNP